MSGLHTGDHRWHGRKSAERARGSTPTPGTNFIFPIFNLPDVDGADPWRSGATLDDLSLQDNFEILVRPILGQLAQHLVDVALIYEKLSRGHGSAPANTSGYDDGLVGFRVD